MSEGEKLRSYLKENKLNQQVFAQTLGISRQALNYHFNKIKLDYEFKELLAEKKHDVFNVKNKFANSSNVKQGLVSTVSNILQKIESNAIHLAEDTLEYMYVPLVSQYAYGGYLGGFADSEYLEHLPKVPWLIDKEYKGRYCTFEVKGDSMDNGSVDSYKEGDKILCREVHPDYWQNKLHIKRWDFVIVHKTDGILVKKIIDHNVERNEITTHSINELYGNSTFNLNEIAQLFNIVQVSRKK